MMDRLWFYKDHLTALTQEYVFTAGITHAYVHVLSTELTQVDLPSRAFGLGQGFGEWIVMIKEGTQYTFSDECCVSRFNLLRVLSRAPRSRLVSASAFARFPRLHTM